MEKKVRGSSRKSRKSRRNRREGVHTYGEEKNKGNTHLLVLFRELSTGVPKKVSR